jgi:RNA polymerase sigma-70 factor (ECF subfamily)
MAALAAARSSAQKETAPLLRGDHLLAAIVRANGELPALVALLETVGTDLAVLRRNLRPPRPVMRLPSPSQQTTLRALGDARVQEMAGRFASALERGDAQGLVAPLTEDIAWSMPPFPSWYHGLEAVTDFAVQVPLSCGGWRHLAIAANGQPTVALYLWDGTAHLAWSINVLTLSGDRIGEITSFVRERHPNLILVHTPIRALC